MMPVSEGQIEGADITNQPSSAPSSVAVRPPEYWPRPIFFALAERADRMVLGDTLQYSRQSFQNRAPLRTPQGWQWITVPLQGGQHGVPIRDVRIRNRHRWIRKHWRALHFNYRTTPFFEFYEPTLSPLFERDWDRLGELACSTVEVLAELLGLPTPLARASNMKGEPHDVPAILERCEKKTLLSASDTVDVDRAFTSSLRSLHLEPLRYRQNFEGFEPEMSTLDLLFNYGPETMSIIRRAAVVEEVALTSE